MPFCPPRLSICDEERRSGSILKAAGISSTILRCPCTFPPDSIRGNMLSGMGVPDLRGGLGTATFYTTNEAVKPRESENVVRLKPGPDGAFLHVCDRPSKSQDACVTCTLQITFRGRFAGAASHRADRRERPKSWRLIREAGATGCESNSSSGCCNRSAEWSDFISFAPSPISRSTPLRSTSIPTRLCSRSATLPNMPAISHRRIGLYHTTGMVEDHAGLNNERISEEAFLDQCSIAWRDREAMMLHELESFRSGLFYCLFDTPDRIQHLFWRFREGDHPANRGKPPDPDSPA